VKNSTINSNKAKLHEGIKEKQTKMLPTDFRTGLGLLWALLV